ncbi:MAG: PQQ-binding-like beta-propeller repeat protein, partial [Ktedonobacteraceae bacterium]
ATIDWNGNALTTQYISSSRLTAKVPAANVGTSGTAEVTVANPKPSDGPSNALDFPIRYGKPSIGHLFPNATVEGDPGFTLTVVGSGFGPESQVQWNNVPRTTRFVSGAELTAQINAADISTAGTAAVAVYDPTPGTRSVPATFAINPATSSAVSFQINTNHSGDMNFDPVSFPTQSAWTANVDGQSSYALIADGKVFITVNVNGAMQLLALDQKTGAVAWGPKSSPDNVAYGAGSIFAVSESADETSGVMRAYNAATGSLEWSTQLPGQYSFSLAPVARDGFVYVVGEGIDGTLYALDESDGSLVWTEPVYGGNTPAVTDDGVYVADACQAYDFRPGTGELVWHNEPPECNGVSEEDEVPVIASGILFAPDQPGDGDYNGDEFDAETGDFIGPFTADNPPAIAKGDGYFLQNGILYGINLSNKDILWSFAGDGDLVTSPIIVNQYVIVGSSSGNLYALDSATGQQVWNVNVGVTIPSGYGFSGLSAGHGLLIVPAGDSVIAYRLATD